MGEASADRAAIADDAMGDETNRIAEQRADARHHVRVLNRRLADKCLHGDAAVAFVDPVESRDAVDVEVALRCERDGFADVRAYSCSAYWSGAGCLLSSGAKGYESGPDDRAEI